MLTSSAQTYSQNIVGYVNQTVQPYFNMYVVPFTVNSSNNAEAVFPCLQGGDFIATWNAVQQAYTFSVYTGTPGGWYDGLSYLTVNSPLLPAGTGLFYNNGSGGLETNTYAGTVVLSQTVTLQSYYNMVGSMPPIAASVEDPNYGLLTALQGGDFVATWDAVQQAYTFSVYTGTPGSWYDGLSYLTVPPPSISVGEGIFYNNGSGGNETWTQTVVVP